MTLHWALEEEERFVRGQGRREDSPGEGTCQSRGEAGRRVTSGDKWASGWRGGLATEASEYSVVCILFLGLESFRVWCFTDRHI